MNEWQSVDKNGVILPWFTESFLAVMAGWDTRSWSVFEWGSGYSTLWFARNCRQVVSVDSDPHWSNFVSGKLREFGLSNTEALHVAACPEDSQSGDACAAYAEAITEYGSFNLVVIDGTCREYCAIKALNHVQPGSRIILDNSDYPCGDVIRKVFEHCEHHSYPQLNHPSWRTDYWVYSDKVNISPEEAARHQRARRSAIKA